MLDFEEYDQPYAPLGIDDDKAQPVRRLRKSRTIKEQIVFWGLNAVILPSVAICYMTIGADGLRRMMSGLSLRLHKLAVPGAEYLESYSGFERLDLAMVIAFILFVAVTILWVRVFRELQNVGELRLQRNQNPIRFFLLIVIAAVVLITDAGIFFVGLSSQASSGWSETPAYVPLGATALYLCGLALIGAWHCDYHYSNRI